jgi:hypothetical protein
LRTAYRSWRPSRIRIWRSRSSFCRGPNLWFRG